MTITNVDFEGYNDFSDRELIEARNTINHVLELRKRAKIFDTLKEVETTLIRLSNCTEDVQYFNIGQEDYSLADIFEAIKLHYKERFL